MTEAYSKPLPKPDPLMKPFWEHAAKRELVVQRCEQCHDRHFPPTHVCPKCLSVEQSWEQVSGEGTVFSWIEMHRAYWPGFASDLPYNVCIVQLMEGPLMVSNLIGDVSGIAVGAPVSVRFDQVTEGVTLPKFELVRA